MYLYKGGEETGKADQQKEGRSLFRGFCLFTFLVASLKKMYVPSPSLYNTHCMVIHKNVCSLFLIVCLDQLPHTSVFIDDAIFSQSFAF